VTDFSLNPGKFNSSVPMVSVWFTSRERNDLTISIHSRSMLHCIA